MFCVACLVMDSIFTLILSYSALVSAGNSWNTACYQSSGYTWHNIVAMCTSVTAVASLWGMFIHGAVACATASLPMTVVQVTSVNRYGHAMVVWTFISAILEAVAFRNEPGNCAATSAPAAATSSGATSSSGSSSGIGSSGDFDPSSIWQVAYTLLWLLWIIVIVMSALLARRCLIILKEASDEAGESQAVPQDEEDPQVAGVPNSGMTAQTVGVPVHFGDGDRASGPGTSLGAPVAGMPVSQGFGQSNYMVAQGMPVAGSVNPPPGTAKVVD